MIGAVELTAVGVRDTTADCWTWEETYTQYNGHIATAAYAPLREAW